MLGDGVIALHVEPTHDGGYAGTVRALSERPDVTAIASTTDQMAFGALVALRDQGVRVPEEGSVTGFNDLAMGADLMPPLSTVHLPLERMGRAAPRIGHASLGGDPIAVSEAVALVIRGSTGPARSGPI